MVWGRFLIFGYLDPFCTLKAIGSWTGACDLFGSFLLPRSGFRYGKSECYLQSCGVWRVNLPPRNAKLVQIVQSWSWSSKSP